MYTYIARGVYSTELPKGMNASQVVAFKFYPLVFANVERSFNQLKNVKMLCILSVKIHRGTALLKKTWQNM
jgi:hypothetical protein